MFGMSAFFRRTMAGAALMACTCGAIGQDQNVAPQVSSQRLLRLVWSDEFNGPDGSPPDPAKWHVIQKGSGFGNNELQYYTKRAVNVHQEKGSLVITARKERYKGHDGFTRNYTSARLETAGLFAQKFGRMEARIKLPGGQGIWPAFWMLGSDNRQVGWPACGEIDIMEKVGFEPSTVHGTLHAEGYSGAHAWGAAYTLPGEAKFTDDYHLYAVEWDENVIRFYVDDALFAVRTPGTTPQGGKWPFNHPYFLLLNLAVGGYWPGNPDATTAFPASMLVDYVRVYQFVDDAQPVPAPSSN